MSDGKIRIAHEFGGDHVRQEDYDQEKLAAIYEAGKARDPEIRVRLVCVRLTGPDGPRYVPEGEIAAAKLPATKLPPRD